MLIHCARYVMKALVWFLGSLVGISSLFARLKKKKKIPHISNPLLLKSATELAAMIRSKQITSEEIVEAYISRIKEVNPILNAVVEPRYLLAMAEAQETDRLIASAKHTPEALKYQFPLLGIPITIKESISVRGMSNKAGRLESHVDIASEDAEAISQLRTAGAIIVAVTNTPELCMCTETFNYVTGRTNNPYDTRKTCGGSSGGEAALLSSGASVIGVGSDIAGSLRIPALYCGVFSHKPTARVVSIIGHVPHCDDGNWKNVFTFGPMVRYAEDLTLLTNVLKDPKGPEIDLYQKVSVQELKYYFMEGDNSGAMYKINEDIKKALLKVINYFDNTYNIKVKKVELKNMKKSFDASSLTLLKIDGVDTIFSHPENFRKWRSVWLEIIKKMCGLSKSLLPSIVYGIMKKCSGYFPKSTFTKAAKINLQLQKEFMDLLYPDGIFLYPTMPNTATFHGEYTKKILNVPYTSIFNSLGLPASHCPLGLTANGMPVGIQVVAALGQDHLTIAVCQELEKAFGGWVPPT